MEVLRQASGQVGSLRRSGKMLTSSATIRIIVSYLLFVTLCRQHPQSENYEIVCSFKLSLPLQSCIRVSIPINTFS
jgi:hypothetical protein